MVTAKMKLMTIAMLSGAVTLASAQTDGCDRVCLRGLADQVVDSILKHQPQSVPTTSPYAATENSRAFQLRGMDLWQTASNIEGARYDVLDPQSGQGLFIAAFGERGGGQAIVVLRFKAEGTKISEIEAYVTRSASDTGEHFNPAGLAKIPAFWWQDVDGPHRSPREQLEQVGKSAFDTSVSVAYRKGCFHFEEGDKVGQDECAAPPDRPVDAKERVPVVDVQQGIVVSIGQVDGVLTTGGSFVPTSMMVTLRKGPMPPNMASRPMPLKEMPETMSVVQLTKFFDGKAQGSQAYMIGEGPAARSPWAP